MVNTPLLTDGRYIISMAVADYSNQAWFQGFNDLGVALFNKPADEIMELKVRRRIVLPRFACSTTCSRLKMRVSSTRLSRVLSALRITSHAARNLTPTMYVFCLELCSALTRDPPLGVNTGSLWRAKDFANRLHGRVPLSQRVIEFIMGAVNYDVKIICFFVFIKYHQCIQFIALYTTISECDSNSSSPNAMRSKNIFIW